MSRKPKLIDVLVMGVDKRAVEFILGAIEAAELCDLPEEVAEAVCGFTAELHEALRSNRKGV